MELYLNEGNIAPDTELPALFGHYHLLLKDIVTEIMVKYEETLYCVAYYQSEILPLDEEGNTVAISRALYEKVQRYFEITGPGNRPRIYTHEMDGETLVDFSFRLPPGNIATGIRYSPGNYDPSWKRLEGDWYVYEEIMV